MRTIGMFLAGLVCGFVGGMTFDSDNNGRSGVEITSAIASVSSTLALEGQLNAYRTKLRQECPAAWFERYSIPMEYSLYNRGSGATSESLAKDYIREHDECTHMH